MLGMLPTPTIMQTRHPDLYPDNLCCLYREDNNHVWVCPESFDMGGRSGFEPKWGGAAIKKANEDALSRHRKQKV